MFFEPGFLGTRAAMYMDVVTVYFAILPFLVAFAIHFARKGDYAMHYHLQLFTLVMTLAIVVVFEIGVRLGGGFLAYAEQSNAHYGFMVAFLIVHILIAIVTVAAWLFLVFTARKAYIEGGPSSPYFAEHKKMGKRVFAGITVTSVMGVMIYVFLFVI